ncbi:MAG: hypothetical protein PHQ89_02425 [Bacilli bacterium]|nr:hypothetical protein [Bacilli bacterium]
MKGLKKVIALTTVMLLVGCTNKAIKESYEKMEVGKEGINGYILDLRIYGTNGEEKVNEVVRVTNYNNEEYKIVKSIVGNIISKTTEETTYIKDGKTYAQNEEGLVVETAKEINYKDPSVYLEGLNNITKNGKEQSETIGEKKYTYYDVTFSKKIVNTILKDTSLKDLEVTKNVEGQVYINSEGYVYRIIYNLDTITINANYYGVDTVRSIIMESKTNYE